VTTPLGLRTVVGPGVCTSTFRKELPISINISISVSGPASHPPKAHELIAVSRTIHSRIVELSLEELQSHVASLYARFQPGQPSRPSRPRSGKGTAAVAAADKEGFGPDRKTVRPGGYRPDDFMSRFSDVLTKLTNDEVAWLQRQLDTALLASELLDEDLPLRGYYGMRGDPGFKAVLYTGPGPHPAPVEFGQFLWMYADEDGEISAVTALVQAFLKRFRPDTTWSTTWVDLPAQPWSGEYGGGGVIVTATKIHEMSMSDWIFGTYERLRLKRD